MAPAAYFGSSGQPSFDLKACRGYGRGQLVQSGAKAQRNCRGLFRGNKRKMQYAEVLTQPQDAVGYWGSSISFTSRGNGRSAVEIPMAKEWDRTSNATNSFLLCQICKRAMRGLMCCRRRICLAGGSSDAAQLRVNVADVADSTVYNCRDPEYHRLEYFGRHGEVDGIQVTPSLRASNHWTGLTNIMLTSPTSRGLIRNRRPKPNAFIGFCRDRSAFRRELGNDRHWSGLVG